MRPARCIAPSECWNRLCSAAGNTQRADWSCGTRLSRWTHDVSIRSCSVASPGIAPGRVYRMYWWMGSAMRPRPWYVSAAPFTGPSPLPVLLRVVRAELAGLERPPPRLVLAVPADGGRERVAEPVTGGPAELLDLPRVE